MKKMKRLSEFLRIIVFFCWHTHIRDGARGKTHSSISVGVRGGGGGYPLHLDHSIAFYAGGFMSNYYFSHFQVMRVFIEHNEHFEIQGVNQWLEGKQIT